MKQCFKCKMNKPLDCFYKHSGMADGHLNKCIECAKKDTLDNTSKNSEYYRQYNYNRYRFERNIPRIWKTKYSSMRMRTSGTATCSNIKGKELLPLKEFLKWCEDTREQFYELYKVWKKAGYKRGLAPSIDRIDNDKGYFVGNMQWVTQSENLKRYFRGLRDKKLKPF